MLGQLSEQAAAATGLDSSTLIVAGGGDGQCAGLGCHVLDAERAYLNLGTAVVSGVYGDAYRADPAAFWAPAAARRAHVLDRHGVDAYVDRLLGFVADRRPMYRSLLGRRMLESAAAELAALRLDDPAYHAHVVRQAIGAWSDDAAGPAS